MRYESVSAPCGSPIMSSMRCGELIRKASDMKSVACVILASIPLLGFQPPPSAGPDFFENSVRPVLATNCYACHTNSELGGLRVDSRQSLLKGGKSGPALVPGDPEKSLLIQAVVQTGELKMPKGGKLKPAEIQALSEWVKMGAPWPEAPKAVTVSKPAGK